MINRNMFPYDAYNPLIKNLDLDSERLVRYFSYVSYQSGISLTKSTSFIVLTVLIFTWGDIVCWKRPIFV